MTARTRRKYWRTSPNGCIRFNRDFSRLGVGRLTMSSRTKEPKEFELRDQLLTKLAESSQIEVLHALRNGAIEIEQLVAADRQQRLRSPDLLADIAIRRNLWEAIDAALPKMGRQVVTRKRYKVSLNALRTKAARFLGDSSTLADLARVPWIELQGEWGGSPADWNHLRRAVSCLMSTVLDDKFHALRRAVMQKFPRGAENHRVPDLSPQDFLRIVSAAPDHAQPCYMVLVLTGMRVGEYLRCTKFQLRPKEHAIDVPGTKSASSVARVYISADYWKWIEIGVPSPLRYKWMRLYWKRACETVGITNITLHDLRHCFAQWSVNAGIAESKVQVALRHSSSEMTRRYSRQKPTHDVGNAVGEILTRAAK
jgi:integrase